MKKLIMVVLFLIVFLSNPILTRAENKINVYFFWGEGCPHCEKQKLFLEELKIKYPQIKVYDYETYYDKKNQQLLKDIGELLGENIAGVPFTVIGNKTFVGFSEMTTPKGIENAVTFYTNNEYDDVVGKMIDEKGDDNGQEESNDLWFFIVPLLVMMGIVIKIKSNSK